MKTIKKLLALTLVLCMVFCLSVAVFATDGADGDGSGTSESGSNTKTNQEASFTKTYKIINEGTSNPGETFTFTFTADHVTDSNANLTTDKMPTIANSTVEYTAGTATVAGLEKTVAVALSEVNWPGVGVYYYKVKENSGTTAGVTYSDVEAWLKVTVAYSESTNTYYTAFVTLSLADENNDGQTDDKTAGFTNVYSAGSLSISKNVTGNMGNQNTYFIVKVTLTGETNKTYASSYSVSKTSNTQNPETIKIGEETTFYLKHGETITISNLPYGVKYTVVENDYTAEADGGYEAAKYSLNNAADTTTSITIEELDSASESVKITNRKNTGIDMGVTLDSLPYILALAVAFGGAVVMITRKRHVED